MIMFTRWSPRNLKGQRSERRMQYNYNKIESIRSVNKYIDEEGKIIINNNEIKDISKKYME